MKTRELVLGCVVSSTPKKANCLEVFRLERAEVSNDFVKDVCMERRRSL
jgi:hypothetical protein